MILFVQGQAFMGSFYTATLYPYERNEDVKKILKGRNFFICSKNDNYNLVSEEKMDEQNQADIKNFVKKLKIFFKICIYHNKSQCGCF